MPLNAHPLKVGSLERCVMSAQVVSPDPMLADNEKTVAYLMELAGDNKEQIAEVAEWGKRRQGHINILRRFVGLLEKNGVFEQPKGRLNKVMEDFATTQCLAIATKNGLKEIDYAFADTQSGPLCADLDLDLRAVEAVDVESPTGLFESAELEAKFLETIRGKDIYELGRMARLLVIDERFRMIPL